MGQFNEIFNPASIYEMFFINVKAVLIYPTLDELQEKNEVMYDRWKEIAKTKYSDVNVSKEYSQRMYEDKGLYYPEYCRIVAITYATLYNENGNVKRYKKTTVLGGML